MTLDWLFRREKDEDRVVARDRRRDLLDLVKDVNVRDVAAVAPLTNAPAFVPLGPTAALFGATTRRATVGGRVRALAVSADGKRIYAGTPGGLWYSADAGRRWQPLDAKASSSAIGGGLHDARALPVGALHVEFGAAASGAGDQVVVGTGDVALDATIGPTGARGVGIRTATGPVTELAAGNDPWTLEAKNLAGSVVLAIIKDRQAAVWAATTEGLFRRPANASNRDAWDEVLSGLCWDVAVTVGSGAEPQRLWVASEGRLRWSTDGGSFQEMALPDDFRPANAVRPEIGRLRLCAAPGGAPHVWVVGSGSRLWRVTAAGAEPVDGAPPDLSGFGAFDDADRGLTVSCSPADADDVVVAGGLARMSLPNPPAAVYRGKVARRDGRWQLVGGDALETRVAPVMAGVGIAARVHAVGWANAGAELWVGTDGGVFRSRDGWGSFESRNAFVPSFEIEHLADHPRAEALLLGSGRAVGAVQAAGPSVWTTVLLGEGGGAIFDPADARHVAVQVGPAVWYRSTDGYAFSPITWFIPPVGASAAVQRAYSEANREEERQSGSSSTPAATIGPNGVTQLAIGTRRVWYTENWGESWKTLPSIDQDPSALAPDGAGPRVYQDLVAGQVRVLRWGSADRLYTLTTDAIYLYRRPPAAGAPTSWERHVLYDGPELKPKKRKSRGDQIPPEMPRTNLAVHDPARGTFGTLYATTERSFDDDDERYLWWFDGEDSWFECGLDVAAPAYAVVVDPNDRTHVYVANALGVYHGVLQEPAAPGDPPTWEWHRFSQGLPETPCVDLVLHAGSRLLRVAVFGCGVFEVPLEVPQNDPATTVFLRAHDHDLRRALIPATPHGPVPSEGATRPYADADYEELRLDASPDIRVRRAPGESPPALFHYESGFASGDTQRRTFEAFAIEAALHRSGDAVVPVTGIEDAEFQPAIERWLQRDEPNTAGAWNRTTGRGDLGNILPIDADVIVADAASADGERTHLDVAGAAFAGSNLENMVVRFAHDVGAAVNRGVVTRVTGHTDSRLEFVEIPDKVTRGDRFEILGPAPGHAMAAATTLMESDPDDVSACRTHAGRILVDVTVHTRTGPIAADRVAVALLRVPFRGLGAASPAAQLPNGWADHLRTDGGAAPGARGAWLTDGWAYFDASQQFRKPTEPLDARRPGVVTFEGSLPDGQWLLCAVVLALDDVVANAARDPFAVARTSRQVALRSVNAIAQPTVRQHAFFEWHQRAPRHGTFTPPVGRPDDSRIVLRAGAGEPLRPKARLHLCFLEQAAAAFEVTLPGGVWTASWSVVDETGAAIAWHPDYPAAGAAIANGSFVWKWDGRRDPPLGAGAPPRGRLVPQGTYRSRLVLRTAAAAGRPARAFTYTAEIIAEGEPYHIYIEGVPKNDSEILQMIADRGRAFSAGGARIPRDCWILAYRGQISDGHAVFLGQGIVEATAVTTGAGTAVATPHDRVYKCWIRDRGADEDRCQLEDVGRADGHIMLDNPGSAVPSNPRFDAEPGLAPPQPRKNNVQAHGGRQDWTTDGLTAGCTAIAPLAGLAAAADRVSERGMLRSVTSTFGNWGVPAAENPALTSPTFVNKQTKRAAANAVSDALSADDHARPILEPPVVAPLDREPLHMQAETQQGIYGGFIQGEIPLNSTVLDEPAQNANAAPKLRIRCTLRDYRRGSAYHLYHHGVVVKHEHRAAGADFEVDIWIPRKVMRGWNSPIPGEDHDPASVRRALADRRFADPLPVNRRNVLVDGRLQIRWYVRHTDGVGNQNIVHRFFPVAPVPAAQFAAQNPGRWRERWPNGATGALAAGVYESVCEYRLQVEPRGADHEWHPELAVTDALSTPSPAGATPAEISEETPHPDAVPANLQYFEATSVLHLRTVP